MFQRILKSVLFTTLIAVLAVSILVGALFFGALERQLVQELKAEAGYIRHALSKMEDDTAYFQGFTSKNRVSLIAPNGMVLFDSSTNAANLGNHLDRPEIASAFETGVGESRRYSATFAEATDYYAVKTQNGNVLRLANTRNSVLGMLGSSITLFVCVIILAGGLSLAAANLLSKRIVEPINRLDLEHPMDNDAYEELSPLLHRLDLQKLELEKRMRTLQEKQDELLSITENMREGMVLFGGKGEILSVNTSAADIFKIDAKQKIGAGLLELTRDAKILAAVASAQAGNYAECTLERGEKYYRFTASPAVTAGKTAGVVLLIMNVSDKYLAENSRREFTANVSHELKTPLTSISGYAEIMRDGLAKPEDMQQFAGRIYEEATRLIALVNDILALSKLDEDRVAEEKQNLDLYIRAQETAARLEPLAAENGVTLAVTGETAFIAGYERLLDEMLYNVVDNAIKYNKPGGTVAVAVERANGKAVFSVSDTGIGIPKAHQERVFERFYRVDKSHSKATGGTGLGLSIVKHGAALHGADIELESEPGRGTTLRLLFDRID